jgi:transcriptional regulator of arginine metabolism
MMNKYSSAQRRAVISQVVRDEAPRSQEELLGLLKRKGVLVAQPTLSRDIHELGLVKTPAGYALASDVLNPDDELALTPQERRDEKLAHAVSEFVLELRKAGTLVVVRTTVAAAQPVARAIDEASLPEIAGTIAGDDTIFLATADSAAADRVIRKFRSMQHPSRTTRRSRA